MRENVTAGRDMVNGKRFPAGSREVTNYFPFYRVRASVVSAFCKYEDALVDSAATHS